ncbi:MAG: type II toxin-antitoxin system RelE/ParE family toxin [Planctomycetaceae bacterium]|nr:type II toxin-antitoxin system RelE/ParE family toxin [Planctomycetaceae bacterium]
MPAITLDDAAREDLIDIWEYIAHDNPQAADRMLDRIWDGFRVVAKFPQGGTLRPELATNLRCYTVGNYVIYFRPTANGIEVARVLHGARDVDALFES